MLIPVLNDILFIVFKKKYCYCFEDFKTVFIVVFMYDFCIVNKDLSYIRGFEFVSDFVMLSQLGALL